MGNSLGMQKKKEKLIFFKFDENVMLDVMSGLVK